MKADSLFTKEYLIDDETGDECGLVREHLVCAVETWSWCNQSKPRTVGDAALVFNVTPRFLADCIAELGGFISS